MTQYYATESVKVGTALYEERLLREPSVGQRAPDFVAGIEQPEGTLVELGNTDRAVTLLRLSKDLRGKPLVIKELYRSIGPASRITWNETVPPGGSVLVETNVSLDGGQTWLGWKKCTNGYPVPDLEGDLSNARVQTRVTLTTDEFGETPEVSDLIIEVDWVYESHSVYRGVISSVETTPLSATIRCIPGDFAVLDTPFPVEKVTVDKFPDAVDLDVPVPYVIGTAKKVPLALIKAYEDISGNQYQYLVGRGDLTVNVVYRDGRVIKEYSGTAQGGGSNYITLSATDTKSDDFYNDAFIEITGGTGAGQVRKIVDYDSSTKQAYVDSNWITSPDATSTYVIREWKKVLLTVSGTTYTAIEFAIAQRERGKLFTRREMAADVTGLQAERNPARAVRSILELAGAQVDAASFTQAEADINAIGGLFVDGACTEERQLYDVITELCLIGRIILGVNESGQFTAKVDKPQSEIFGMLSTDENIAEVSGLREIPLDSLTGTLEVSYRRLFDSNEYRLKALRTVNPSINRTQTLEFDFIYDKNTADRVCDYLAKRKKSLDSVITLTAGLNTRGRQLLDLTYLKIPELNITGVYQITGISKQGTSSTLDLVKYDVSVFTYDAAPLPSDPVTDAPADFRFTPPDAVANLSVSWELTQPSYTAVATLTWTNPDENYREAVVEYKKSSDSLYTVYGVIPKPGTSISIPGLTPGLQYDFRITSVNEFDLQGGVAALLNQLAPGDSTAPSTPTALSGPTTTQRRIDSITWTWNKNTETDIKDYHVRVWTSSRGGTKKADTYVPHSDNPSYTYYVDSKDLATPKTYYLEVAARDFSGNESAFTSRVAGSTRGIETGDLNNSSVTTPIIADNSVNEVKRIPAYVFSASSGTFSLVAGDMKTTLYSITHNLGRVPLSTVYITAMTASTQLVYSIVPRDANSTSFIVAIQVYNTTSSTIYNITYSFDVYFW